jgi:hypothetical protein
MRALKDITTDGTPTPSALNETTAGSLRYHAPYNVPLFLVRFESNVKTKESKPNATPGLSSLPQNNLAVRPALYMFRISQYFYTCANPWMVLVLQINPKWGVKVGLAVRFKDKPDSK